VYEHDRERIGFKMNADGSRTLFIQTEKFDPTMVDLGDIQKNTNPSDDGAIWNAYFENPYDATSDDYIHGINDMFNYYANFNPDQYIYDGALAPIDRLFGFMGDTLSAFIGEGIAGAEEMPEWFKCIAEHTNEQLGSLGDLPANVRLYKHDMLGLKDIYNTISEELSPGTMLLNLDNAQFVYDNITESDAYWGNKGIDLLSKGLSSIPKVGGYVASVLENLSIHRNQLYDATQKAYKIDFDYLQPTQGTVPYLRNIQLEIRMGQYTNPKGSLSYGIVEAYIKIQEKVNPDNSDSWRTIGAYSASF